MDNNKNKLNLIIYKRVSTREQNKSGLGLLAQSRDIKTRIRGLENEYDEINIIKEVSEIASGKGITTRNLLLECIKLVKSNQDNFLIVQKIDRLSRNIRDGINIFDELKKRIIFCDIKTNNMMVISIFLAHAQEEREMISLRIKKALYETKQKGTILGRPWKRNKRGEIIPGQNGKAIQKMFIVRSLRSQKHYEKIIVFVKEMRKKDCTLYYIAKTLNNLGKRTITGKKYNHITIRNLLQK